MPRFLTVATVGVVAVGIASGLAPTASAEPARRQNVSLTVDIVGDSYASGDGMSDTYLDPADQRNQSKVAPALQALSRVAQENPGLAVDANLAAAAGAVTADFFYAQTSGETVVNTPQRDQIRPTAQVVIVGFGGNDAELAQVLGVAKPSDQTKPGDLDAKIRSLAGLLDLSASDQAYLDQASAPGRPPTLVARMVQVLNGISQRAPGARILVTTYPVAIDAQNPNAVALIGARELVTVQKFIYDLNEAITRAVRLCQCADLVDMSTAVAGHEAFTTDSAFTEPEQATRQQVQPNDEGAALMANPLAMNLAKVLGFQVPADSDGTVTEPANIQTRSGVSDIDGDSVPDADDAAPTVPDAPRSPQRNPNPDVPGPLHQGLPPNNKPNHGRDNTDNDRDRDNDRVPGDRPFATDEVVAGVADTVAPLVAPLTDTVTPVADTVAPLAAGLLAAPAVDPAAAVPTTIAAVGPAAAVPTVGPEVGPTPVAARSPRTAQQQQSPPLPERPDVRGFELPSAPVPEFGPPGETGVPPSRDITMQQLQFADSLTPFAPGDRNPVTADSSGAISGKTRNPNTAPGPNKPPAPAPGPAPNKNPQLSVGDKQAQSVRVVRSAADGTMEVELSTAEGLNVDLGVAKYSNQQLDRTAYKLSPESTKEFTETGRLPDYGTMLPGDTITRVPSLPAAVATEKAVGRPIGNLLDTQFYYSYNEGPMQQYSVTRLGDGRYTVTYGESAVGLTRNGLSIGPPAARVGANVDDVTAAYRGVEVQFDARNPTERANLTTTIEGLAQGVAPTLAPGTFYNAVTVQKGEDVAYGGVNVSGTNVPTAPGVSSKIGAHRQGVTTTTTSLMRSVDGNLANGESIGQSVVETTRLGTGNLTGEDLSYRVGPFTIGGDTVPTSVTIRTFTDGPLRSNEVTFTANGQKYTMSEGDMVQRAREMSVADPETVAGNRVLSDLARGVGVRPALTDPPNTVKSAWDLSNKDINDALQALVTPPMPERNVPPMPERNVPPMPERRPDTPPLPERRADYLPDDVEQNAFADYDSDLVAGEASEDTLGGAVDGDQLGESTVDDGSWNGVSPDGYSVPGVDASDNASASDPGSEASGSASDSWSGVSPDGYSVPGVDAPSSEPGGYAVADSAPASESGNVGGGVSAEESASAWSGVSPDGYSVPGVDAGSTETDSSVSDAAVADAGSDTGYSDSSVSDSGVSDSSVADSGVSADSGESSSSDTGDASASYGGDSTTSDSASSDSSSFGGSDSTSSFGGSSDSSTSSGDSSGGDSSSSGGDSSSSSSSSDGGGGW